MVENKPKLPKCIKFGKLPVIVGIGGKEASKDMKLMFIEKELKKHFTIRFITDKEGRKFTLDMHTTDETKDKIANKKEAYTSLMKVTFDLKAIEKEAESINTSFLTLLKKMIVPIESSTMLEGKTLVPLSRNIKPSQEKSSGKELVIDDTGLAELISNIHGVDDLTKYGYNAGMTIEGEKVRGAVFLKDGKWNYIDMLAFAKETFILLAPYLEIEGVITKERFFEELKSYP
jgi:hypothetical protein